MSHSHTFTPGPLIFKDDFQLVVGPADDPAGNPIAIIQGPPGEMFGNAILYSKAPDLYSLVQRIFVDLNGRNATERATNSEYAASPLCKCIDDLVRDAADLIHNMNVKEGTR